jgi:hypothetical protein
MRGRKIIAYTLLQVRTLWTYGDIANQPHGVERGDANTIFPISEARGMLERGCHIQHVSDVVRMRACSQQPGRMPTTSFHLLQDEPTIEAKCQVK